MIALPPLFAGGVKAIDAWPSPGVAAPMMGAPGTVGLIAISRETCDAGFQLTSPA